jgi:hypothetical protein
MVKDYTMEKNVSGGAREAPLLCSLALSNEWVGAIDSHTGVRSSGSSDHLRFGEFLREEIGKPEHREKFWEREEYSPQRTRSTQRRKMPSVFKQDDKCFLCDLCALCGK